MKIAIDVSPLQSGHKIRGVGFYLSYLKEALLKYYSENDYLFFERKEDIDDSVELVHYPYFDPFFLTLPFTKKHKTVVTVHDLTPLIFPKHFPAGIKGNFRWQVQRFNLRKVNGIITDSHASKKDIERIVGVSSDTVSVVYLAAGEEFREVRSEKFDVRSLMEKYKLPERFVLYVGDVTWNKNLPRLLQAIKELNLPLVMVGKSLVSKNYDTANVWNTDLVAVQKMAKENHNVHLLGFVPTEDLVGLYNLATVFVFPSIYEGFGLPIVEAMQSGCPTIISKEGCMPEVGGDAAYYFDGYNTDSLVKSIHAVFHSEKLQKELTKKGLAQAKKFSWEMTAEKTIAAYKKILR